jgi:hypothetical protein
MRLGRGGSARAPDAPALTEAGRQQAGGRGFRASLAHVNWGVLDQAISSGTSFLLAFVLVRRLSAEEFGAFSLVVVVYLVAMGTVRAVTTEPLMIRHGGATAEIRAVSGRVSGLAITIGVVLAVQCLAAAAIVNGPLRSLLVVLGLTFPLLAGPDAGRVTCFAMGRPRTAAINDAVWASAQLVLLALVLSRPDPPLWALVGCWLVPGALAGLLVLAQVRIRPSFRGATSWLVENRALGQPLLGVYVLTVAPSYLLFALAPLVSTLAELGEVRAAYVPFGAFGVVLQSAWLLLLPAASGRNPRATWRLAVRASLGLATAALLFAAAMVALLPAPVGEWLIGEQWNHTAAERALFGLAVVCYAAAVGPMVALSSLREPRRLLWVRAVTGPAVLASGLLLAHVAGAPGIATAIMVGDALMAVLSWLLLARLTAAGR